MAFRPVDWSLERREAGEAAHDEGIEAATALGAAMKYPTVTAEVSPNQVLRDRLGLTGAKEGCGTGDCGACSIILDDRLVCSCLVLGAEAEGRRVET